MMHKAYRTETTPLTGQIMSAKILICGKTSYCVICPVGAPYYKGCALLPRDIIEKMQC